MTARGLLLTSYLEPLDLGARWAWRLAALSDEELEDVIDQYQTCSACSHNHDSALRDSHAVAASVALRILNARHPL